MHVGNHPKVPCAIRLAERKVGRVIGMLDPDDRISGRGQRALRKAGIATDLFPHDLMGEVEELNRDFVRDREFVKSALHTEDSRLRRTFTILTKSGAYIIEWDTTFRCKGRGWMCGLSHGCQSYPVAHEDRLHRLVLDARSAGPTLLLSRKIRPEGAI